MNTPPKNDTPDKALVERIVGAAYSELPKERWSCSDRDEFTDWVAQIECSTGILAKLAWDKSDCTNDTDKVIAAKEAANAYVKDAPSGKRNMLPSDIGLPCPSCAAYKPTPTDTADRYFITKGGAYYRPNAEGYTRDTAQAGRFTLEEAISHSHPNGPDGPRDGIRYELAPKIVTDTADRDYDDQPQDDDTFDAKSSDTTDRREAVAKAFLANWYDWPDNPEEWWKSLSDDERSRGLRSADAILSLIAGPVSE